MKEAYLKRQRLQSKFDQAMVVHNADPSTRNFKAKRSALSELTTACTEYNGARNKHIAELEKSWK